MNRQVINIVLLPLFVFALKPNYCIYAKTLYQTERVELLNQAFGILETWGIIHNC